MKIKWLQKVFVWQFLVAFVLLSAVKNVPELKDERDETFHNQHKKNKKCKLLDLS